ncbi:MAG: PAS domain-containing protein [Burkholderiales bacterium]|nr:PAS domain-containing protein [Burkholderiales bacterium]
MSNPTEPRPRAAPPAAALLTAWLEQTRDLLALTDAAGRIQWANAAFERATGLGANGDIMSLTPADWQAGASRATLLAGLRSGNLEDTDLALRIGTGAILWVRARVGPVGDERLWTLADTTALRELDARAQHQSELLDMAQEFGRLGVWEREIPSGKGRWDRHVFRFWGLDPTGTGTPDYAAASAYIHPDDRTSRYLDSTRQAGRYAQRYRVLQADGGVRWIHSHWEVRNSPQGRPDRAIGIMVDDTEVYELARSLDSTAAQLKLAVDLGRIVIWRHDLKTNRLQYNDHGYAVLGMSFRAEGLTLDEVRARTHPDDIATVMASARQALQTNEPVDVESRYLRADGSWRYMLVRRIVERNASGEALAFVGVSLDLTDQIEHSRRAEQLAHRLAAAAKAARVGIWTTALDNIQTEWNEQMYELFDMVGASRPPTLAEFVAQCVHPDDAARFAQAAQAYLRGQHGATESEFRIRHRDGRIRWIVLRADIDRSGTDALRAFGIAMDVTERHEAVAALHAASERAALIAQHAGIGTWEAGEHRDSARWDDQMYRLRGLEPRLVAPDRDERIALVHPDDRDVLLDAHGDFDSVTQPTAYEFRVRLPDGSYRWLASRSAVMRDDAGKVVRRVGVNWDVTEARSAALARQQALLAERESQAKSQFLSRMSHELRTPLNAVLGFTQLLQLEAQQAPAAGAASKLDHIRTAGEHLLTLIDDALDLSSLQSGTMKLDLQPVQLASAVARALPLVHDLAARQRVAVRAGGLDGAALADPTRLLQVLLNLLTNAIKYNRPGGAVVVESMATQDRVRVSVRDTGRGMRPEQLARLFEPFNRLGVEGEGIEGSGIGLTIVKALVERMGGHIEVSSQPGQGTVFEVTLPAPAEHADWSLPIAGDFAVPPSALPQERRGQLLYIEDNDVNVLLVEELVKSVAGLRIVSETTGATGVDRARTLRPDLILIDMQLPDFDGYEVLRRLRAQPETAGTACIALSANAMPEDIARGLASGFDDYWTKPIKFKPFLQALERLFPPSSA